MFEAEFCLPVPLQHVDTDLSLMTHVGVKNLGQEIPFGWNRREVLPEDQTHSENATSKWSSLCWSIKNSSHEHYVLTLPNFIQKKRVTELQPSPLTTHIQRIQVSQSQSTLTIISNLSHNSKYFKAEEIPPDTFPWHLVLVFKKKKRFQNENCASIKDLILPSVRLVS